MQSPWFLDFSGGAPTEHRVFGTDQIIILHATLHCRGGDVPSEIDTSAARLRTALPDADLPQPKFLLCARVTPAEYDVSYDRYADTSSDVILTSFPVGTGSFSRPVKFAVRAGSLITLTITSSVAISAEMLASVSVHCGGVLLNGVASHSGWRPVIRNKWFSVKPTVKSTSVTGAPPHILAPELRAGQVAEARCVSSCGTTVRWANNVESPLHEVVPYRRTFTPCRADKVVRIRRFPHRNADVIGEVPFGTQLEAIGQTVDDVEGETYVLWDKGGWSRIAGSSGLFLIESQLGECEVFETPRLFTSSNEDRGVRIRATPSLKGKQIGEMEPNEVREAIAIHIDPEAHTKFVQWKSGGYSCLSGVKGQFLVEIIPHHLPLRAPPLRATRPPPSPEIVTLDRKRPRREAPVDEEEEADVSLPAAHKRRMDARPVDHGISPSLLPQSLQQDLSSGKVPLSSLPAVSLRAPHGNDNDDDEESECDSDDDDSEYFSGSEEVDGSDEELFTSDDYDEDAFDDGEDDDDDEEDE